MDTFEVSPLPIATYLHGAAFIHGDDGDYILMCGGASPDDGGAIASLDDECYRYYTLA